MKVHHCCFGQDYFPAYGTVSPGQVWSNFGPILAPIQIQMKYGMKFQAEMKSKSGSVRVWKSSIGPACPLTCR